MSDAIGMGALISHRFRGFYPHENTLAGLNAALDFGVLNIEFDIRVAACGTPMIYHDEFALDKNGKQRHLCDFKAPSYNALGGDFGRMPSFEQLIKQISCHKNKSCRLLVDIKDCGFEHEIHALIMLYKLQERTVYVSWQADVLYKMHSIAPNVPLCFSYWSMDVSPEIMTGHKVYKAQNGNITRTNKDYIIGERSGWSVATPLSGDMLDILCKSGGGICVPQVMITRALSDFYHSKNLFVSCFSYTDWQTINDHKKFKIDFYFIDNKSTFTQLL